MTMQFSVIAHAPPLQRKTYNSAVYLQYMYFCHCRKYHGRVELDVKVQIGHIQPSSVAELPEKQLNACMAQTTATAHTSHSELYTFNYF